MESIEIEITSLGYLEKIYIDVINKKVITNISEKNISQFKLDELIRIIRTWKEKYIGNSIDSESFVIRVNTTEGVYVIKGKGAYPKNYSEFKEWVGSLYE